MHGTFPSTLLKGIAALLLFFSIWSAEGQRIKDHIYIPLKDTHFCFRRTNGSSQFGCSSSIGGNVGLLAYMESSKDVERLLQPSGEELAPYIALLKPHLFTGELLARLEDSQRFNGILLLDEALEEEDDLQAYSDDQVCPNEASSLYGPFSSSTTCTKWNPSGQATLFKDWSFPIMLVSNNDSMEALKKCYFEHNDPSLNSSWPYCAVEMRSHMYSAVDTTTCMRRSNMINSLKPTPVCDPMGDLNLFYTAKSRLPDKPQKESFILITTRLDSVTLFDRAEITAASPVTGIVTLLTLASLLSKSTLPHLPGNKNVLLAFMNGESFDYIGSSRMVYDMTRGDFPFPKKNESSEENPPPQKQLPIDLNDVEFVLELDQVFSKYNGDKLWGHFYEPTESSVNPYLVAIKAAASGKGINFARNSKLPPSSSMSILREKKDLPCVLLSNYEDTFENPYYHSIYDKAPITLGYSYEQGEDQKIVKRISDFAEMIMEFLHAELTETVQGDFKADPSVVNELLHCYLDTANCTYFQAALSEHLPPAFLSEAPFPQYVGVQRSIISHSRMTYHLLGLLTGEILSGLSPSNCTQEVKGSNIFDYIFMRSLTPPSGYNFSSCVKDPECGHCFKTTTFRTPAVSPAFTIEDYDFKSGKYSSWAESLWKITSARIFLRDSPGLQVTHFLIGIFVAVLSYVLMWWLNRKASLLFSPVPSGNSSAIVTNDFSQAEAL